MVQSELESKEQALATHRRNLQDFELQKAMAGSVNVPILVLRGIDDETASIERLEEVVAALKEKVVEVYKVDREVISDMANSNNGRLTYTQALEGLGARQMEIRIALARVEEGQKAMRDAVEGRMNSLEQKMTNDVQQAANSIEDLQKSLRLLWVFNAVIFTTLVFLSISVWRLIVGG